MAKPKSSAGYRVGIVNPLTLVGNEIKTILRERSFPFAKVALLDATGKVAGALTEVSDEPAVVSAISDDELEDLDLVFFCGPPAGNREWIDHHREDRFAVIDVSQPSTIEKGKLAIAGINLDDIKGTDTLLISPHPVTIPIALILHQIETLSAVELCTATVVQPASEFEQIGVEELAQQTISVLNIQTVPKEVFDRQLAFNLYPALEHNEEFIVEQIRTLTDPDVQFALLITQGTIFHGHTFSLFLKTRDDLSVDQITSRLRENPAIVLPEGDQTFGTIDAAGKDEVLVAEVRRDPTIRGGFWVWAVCDNLRRSSALNAVLVAEKVLFADSAN
ncbi:MAG TPA: Asd/ArgC dimerization domain-containing protein [Thermoanaerobaculia bacterium]|nr:Asd/ArgC dimerization domain-containing protein [Thermoanaerobaculia bacterium]